MYQGTTPTIPLKFKNIDLTSAKIFLTIKDEHTKEQITFVSGEDFTIEYDDPNTVGTLRLTQEQTLKLTPGSCSVQARFVFADNSTGATNTEKLHIDPVLLKEVIKYV